MTQEKRLKDAKAAAKEGDIRVFQTHHVGVSCFRGFRFAAPPAKSHSLRSGVRPFRSRLGVYSLPGYFFLLSKRKMWVALSLKCVLMMIFADNGVIYSEIEGYKNNNTADSHRPYHRITK